MINGGSITPKPVADMTLQFFNPRHSTIVCSHHNQFNHFNIQR
mgnify:CR=1 FL=1